MKLWAVAILAGAMMSACGVGADEDPSVAQLGANGQALTQGTPVPVPPPDDGQTREETTNPTGSGPVDPGAVGIPQDPIPLWQGRPGLNAAPAPTSAATSGQVTKH